MTKGSIRQEDVKILNIYVLNRSSKHMKQKHRPGHTLINCGKKELDFIQKVYKIQNADNSLTVSQKNK